LENCLYLKKKKYRKIPAPKRLKAPDVIENRFSAPQEYFEGHNSTTRASSINNYIKGWSFVGEAY
jgi:hypothetical protein